MSSKVPKQKRNVFYSQASLELALKDIRERGQGIRVTCRKYGIPKTTIQDRLTGKRPVELKNRGPAPVIGIPMEKQVVTWLVHIAKCGFHVKKQEMLDTVQKILKDYQTPNPFKNDRPGQTWYVGFLRRHPEISLLSTEYINKAIVTEEYIRKWFRELAIFLSESGQSAILKYPERIFNASESGFSLCPETKIVLGPNVKAGNEKDNLTVLVNFNASGQMCPPLVVFPYLNPPTAVTDSIPPDWILGRSESGWMKSEIFCKYIVNFNSWLEKNCIQKPVLLLLDGRKSHMSMELSSMCEQLGIILYALPPNTTHMQVADLSVFGPLKTNWKKTSRSFSVTETNFCQLFKDTIEDPQMPTYIRIGFRKCGLFPFDADAVNYTQSVQNTMERPNNPRMNEETGITNQGLVATRKVIRPVLKKKNEDIKFNKEVKKLRMTEPTELEVVYETGSENQTTVCPSTSLLTENETNVSSASLAESDQIKAVIARVYHYFVLEYEKLQEMYKYVDLTPLSRFTKRTAVATGVSETTVLQILQEEEERNAANKEDPPQKQPRNRKNRKRRRVHKRPKQTDSSHQEDSSDDANDEDEHSRDDHPKNTSILRKYLLNPETRPPVYPEVETLEVKIEPADEDYDKVSADPLAVKVEPPDDEQNIEQAGSSLEVEVKLEPRDDEPDMSNNTLVRNEPGSSSLKGKNKQKPKGVPLRQQHIRGRSTTVHSSEVPGNEGFNESSLLGDRPLKMEIEIDEEGFS